MLGRMLVQLMLRTDGWHRYLSDFDFRYGSKPVFLMIGGNVGCWVISRHKSAKSRHHCLNVGCWGKSGPRLERSELLLLANCGHSTGSLFGISFIGDKPLGGMFSQEPFYLGDYERHRRLIVQRYVIRTIQYDQLGVGN